MSREKFNSSSSAAKVAAAGATVALLIGGYTVIEGSNNDTEPNQEVIFGGEVGLDGIRIDGDGDTVSAPEPKSSEADMPASNTNTNVGDLSADLQNAVQILDSIAEVSEQINREGVEVIITDYIADIPYPKGDLSINLAASTQKDYAEISNKATGLFGWVSATGPNGTGEFYGGYVDFNCNNFIFQMDEDRNLTKTPYAKTTGNIGDAESIRIDFTDTYGLEGMCDQFTATQEQLKIVTAAVLAEVLRGIS